MNQKIILCLLFLVFFAIIIMWPRGQIFKMNEKFMITETDHNTLAVIIKMLKDIHGLFKKFGIRYWMDGATLLGAAKYKGIIPWDTDGDMCILAQDKLRFLELEDILKEMGYGLVKFWAGYKIYPLNGLNIKDYNRNWAWETEINDISDKEYYDYKYPYIDIFLCQVSPNNPEEIYYTNKTIRKLWKNLYWNTKEVFPLKEYKFNNTVLIGPNKAKPYLDRLYGDDWETVDYKAFDQEYMRHKPILRSEIVPDLD